MNDMSPGANEQDHDLPFSQEQEIDRLCSQFEQQWRAGQSPSIEEYLNQVAAPLRAALLMELIAAEVDLRQQSGEEVQVDEYHERFPDQREAVDAGWAIIEQRRAREVDSAVEPPPTPQHARGGQPDRTDQNSPQPVPAQIGRYEIRDVLGEGGFGRVYLAYDPQLQRKVALKVPGRNGFRRPRASKRSCRKLAPPLSSNIRGWWWCTTCSRMAMTCTSCRSTSTVRIWPTGQTDDNPSPEQIVSLIKEVVEAVGFAHQHDLVHRDLKPANLLVDRQGHPHVADFGLALNESLTASAQR